MDPELLAAVESLVYAIYEGPPTGEAVVSVRVGVGVVNGITGFSSLNVVQCAKNFLSGMSAECVFQRGLESPDAPPLTLKDFSPAGGADAAAEKAELLILAGHGGGSQVGLYLPPDGETSVDAESATFGGALRWVVMDACSIFSADFYDPMLWKNTFNGIHQLIGSKNPVNDNPLRETRFSLYLLEGKSVVEAWRRACEESADRTQNWATMLPEAAEEAVLAETLQKPAPLTESERYGLKRIRPFSV